MTWITHLRQRSIWFLVMLTLVLSLALAACGQQANASHSNATNNYSAPQQSQTGQPSQPGTGNNQGNSIKSIDQQVQSIMGQLDGAQNDVNSSSSASSQDGGQQP